MNEPDQLRLRDVKNDISAVMMGATGAVGSAVAACLLPESRMKRLTLVGRRSVDGLDDARVTQHTADMFNAATYETCLPGHTVAICTFGTGQPTKVSKSELVRVDKEAVLAFARACKKAGIQHFELLGSVGADAASPSFFLRTKGELEDELKSIGFTRLSIFRPSMILTPTNRYGFSQAVTLAVWPLLKPFLRGRMKKFRGIPVERLGRAMAANILNTKKGVETLHWDDFISLSR